MRMGNFQTPPGYKVVYSRYRTVKGKRVYPKKAKFFRFLVKI
jgi:hypothetical protein